jgi:hypothetical protein
MKKLCKECEFQLNCLLSDFNRFQLYDDPWTYDCFCQECKVKVALAVINKEVKT